MQEAKATIDRINIPCMDVICAQSEKECEGVTEGLWLQSAVQVLENNQVHLAVFAEAL